MPNIKCTIAESKMQLVKTMRAASQAPDSRTKTEILMKGYHEIALKLDPKDHAEAIDMIIRIGKMFPALRNALPNPAVAFNQDYDPHSLEVKKEENTSDGITNDEVATRKSEVKRTFFRDRFGKEGARAQMYFQRQIRDDLVNAFLVDRKNSRLVTEETINANVRELKQELLDRITSYFKDVLGIDPIALHGTLTLFPNPDTISDILKPNAGLRNLISQYLTPGLAVTSRTLMNKYKSYKNKGVGWENDKKFLDAYNAWIGLNHFDTLVELILPGMIKFNQEVRNQLSEKSSYSTNFDKATNMWSNGFGDENEDIADLVSDVTQMLIQSSKYYAWKSNEPMEDKYLSFLDFNDIIGKVKKLVDNPQAKTMKISELVGLENLTQTTNNVLDLVREVNKNNGHLDEFEEDGADPTLYQLVALMSANPQEYLHSIFDILTNTDVVDKLIDNDNRPLFNDIDRNVMWSVGKEIFGHTPEITGRKSRSIFDLHQSTKNDKIYEIVTLIADSMFSEDYLQYYLDRDGKFQTRLLKDYALDELKREIRAEMQETNGIFNKKKFESFKLKYNVQIDTRDSKIVSSLERGEYWQKDDPNSNLKIPVVTLLLKEVKASVSGLIDISCKHDGPEVKINGNAELVWKDKNFRQFLKDLLGFDFNNDVDYATAVEEAFKDANGTNYSDLVAKLSRIAGTVLYNQVFNNDILPGALTDGNKPHDKQRYIQQVIKAQYGKSVFTPDFNKELGIVNMIPKSIEGAYLRELAVARAINYSMTSSAQVKTGEGTALANFCLSRLRNSHHYQLMTQNKRLGSATRELSYVNNENGLFEGIVSRREVKTDQVAKASTGFSSIESYLLSFINDWISAFIKDKDSNTYLGNGHASFLPTVNSDKSQIDGLLCNLYATSKLGIKYIDMNDMQIEDEMLREFGPMYEKIVTNIGKQLTRLTDFIGIPTTDLAQVSPIEYNREILNRINQHYLSQAKPGLKAVKAISEGLHRDLTAYNSTHTRNPIQVGDQVHYIQDKKTGLLTTNKCLEALYGRFSAPVGIRKALIEPLYKKGEESAASVSGFFRMKDLQTIRELLRDGFVMPLKGKKRLKQKEIQLLRGEIEGFENLKSWICLDGTMALAKVEGFPTNDLKLIESYIATGDSDKIEVHPMVTRLNRMSYLTTQQYVCSVGGAHYVYKGGGSDVLKEEAARWLASNKRNVCYASTVHKYQAATLDGVPKKLNMAIIDDIKADVYSIMGDLDGHKPIDGGMFVNSWFGDLENDSLAGERAGVDKKQFGTFYFEDYAAGGIIKTAGFAATNDRMRRSSAWRNLQLNMSDRPWVKENPGANGADVLENDIDITIGRNGETIDWGPVFYKRLNAQGRVLLYRMAGVKRIGPNTYEIYEFPVTTTGNIDRSHPDIVAQLGASMIRPVKRVEGSDDGKGSFMINTNWKLFNIVFGGYNSLELKGNKLDYSENSRKLMVRALNEIGYKRDHEHGYLGRTVNEIRTLDDFWLPLKYSDCHYTPNIGAIKSSYFNVNPSSAMSEVQTLNHMMIDMAQLGIQLDKEHHADQAEVSMPTQIIQACANKGYTIEHSSELYNALATLTELSISDCMDGVRELIGSNEDTGKLKTEVAKIIVDSLIHGSGENEALETVCGHLIEKAQKGLKFTKEDIDGRIPWSDSSVYKLIYSKIASSLTNSAIKMKFPGSLSVICPTHKMENLYGDRQLSTFEKIENGALSELDALEAYQLEILLDKGLDPDNMPTNKYLIFDKERDAAADELQKLNLASRILTQHNYNIEVTDDLGNKFKLAYDSKGKIALFAADSDNFMTINTPHNYYDLKDIIVNGVTLDTLRNGLMTPVKYTISRVYENIKLGRELGAYNVRYRDMDGNAYNIFDLDSTSNLFALNEFGDKDSIADDIKDGAIEKYNNLVAKFSAHPAIQLRYGAIMKIINKQLESNYKFLNEVPKTAEGFDAIRKAFRTAFYKEQEIDLFKLSNDFKGERNIRVNGKEVVVNPQTLDIIPYELIMPKIYLTYFNLQEYDDIQEILADKDFFTKRAIDKLKTDNVSDIYCDYILKKMNGDHIYIVDSHNGLGQGIWDNNPNFQTRTLENGTVERIDPETGETMYTMASANDKVVYKSGTSFEVIITDNPAYYILHMPHNFVKFSNLRVREEQLQQMAELLKDSTSRSARKFYRVLTNKQGKVKPLNILRQRNQFIDNLDLSKKNSPNKEIAYLIKDIEDDGNELHASFNQSLNVLAARIPAQSQQSFMPQRVVAFDTKNINTAMVSTFLLFLQGSKEYKYK